MHITLALYVFSWVSLFLFFSSTEVVVSTLSWCGTVCLCVCVCLQAADVIDRWWLKPWRKKTIIKKNNIPYFSQRGHVWRYKLLWEQWRERERLIAESGQTNNISGESVWYRARLIISPLLTSVLSTAWPSQKRSTFPSTWKFHGEGPSHYNINDHSEG